MAAKKKAAKKARSKNRRIRDDKGLYLEGNPGGPGRKPGIKVDFREAVRIRAKEIGVDIRKELGTMAMLLLNKAKAGDVAAAKFVTERLCGLLTQELDITSSNTSTVHISDQAREDLKKIMARHGVRDAMLDELEKRGKNGTG